ncbi:MAG: hypothetical protein M0Q91_17635 [Methanoregula sp.]|jgi:hypothetical protein|nr:hypothetical protein [Methanoregula sp.]
MITEDGFISKVAELMDITKADALEKARTIYRSSSFNVTSDAWENDYLLPKLFMTAYADRIKDLWHPLSQTKENLGFIKTIALIIGV